MATKTVSRSLLLIRQLTPRLGVQCGLLFLGAVFLISGVSFNRGLLAWSSIFVSEHAVPKPGIERVGYRTALPNTTSSHRGTSKSGQRGIAGMARGVYYVTGEEPSEIGADQAVTDEQGKPGNDKHAVTTYSGMEDVQEILPGFQPRQGNENATFMDGTKSSGPLEGSTNSQTTMVEDFITAMDKSTETSIGTPWNAGDKTSLTSTSETRPQEVSSTEESSTKSQTTMIEDFITAVDKSTETSIETSWTTGEHTSLKSTSETRPQEMSSTEARTVWTGEETSAGVTGSSLSTSTETWENETTVWTGAETSAGITNSSLTMSTETWENEASVSTGEKTSTGVASSDMPTSPETLKEGLSSIMTTTVAPTKTLMPFIGTSIKCGTTFCKKKGKALSAIFGKNLDPCDNFYAYICADRRDGNEDNEPNDSADDALSGTMEEMAVNIFKAKSQQKFMPLFNLYGACMEKGVVTDDQLKVTLLSLDLDVAKGEAATIQDVLKAAATLLLKLDNAPLLSLETNMNPRNSAAKVIAFEEGDCLLSRIDAMDETTKKSLKDLACKFVTTVLHPGSQDHPLCTALESVAVDLAKVSTLSSHFSDRMFNYRLVDYSRVSMFIPMLDRMTGAEKHTGHDAMFILKNPDHLQKVEDILELSPVHVYAYMAFHTTVYLSPFLEDKDGFWEPAMFLVTRQKRSRAVTKSRLCLRMADRVLPSLTMVAIERAASATPLFSELMADVIAEEVRSAFIDEVMAIQRVDNWTKHVLTRRAQGVGLHSFYPARYSMNLLVKTKAQEIGAKVQWKNNSLEYFLEVSAVMAADWASPERHLLVERRRDFSLFDTDCRFDAQKNAVVLPLAFYDLSVPTSMKERMFHIPRIGPRLVGCLFRATFATNFFRPNEYFWTEYSSSNFEATGKCLATQYKKQPQDMPMFTTIEENAGLRVSFKAYQDRLFSKKYLQMDYGLEGLENVTADQLFFAFYAMSMCGSSAQDASSMTVAPQDRVNVPLMNSAEFARSFDCAEGKLMNPANKCKFWD